MHSSFALHNHEGRQIIPLLLKMMLTSQWNYLPKVKQLESGILWLGGWIPRWLGGKESACQCRRPRRRQFDPWVRKILWRRKWQPTAVFLPGKSMDTGAWRATGHGVAESDTTTRLSMHLTRGQYFPSMSWGTKETQAISSLVDFE